MPVMNTLRPDDLFLYATNTGVLYPKNVDLAKAKVGIVTWVHRVRTEILPSYEKEFGSSAINAEDALEVSNRLKAYYEQHVKEGA